MRAQHRARRRLPDHRVAHQRGRRRKVAGNRGEVERRHRVDEALERPVLHAVPHDVAADRLLLVELLRVVRVESPEVDQLRRRIDLGLDRRLRLTQHRRRIQRRAPRRRQQLRGSSETPPHDPASGQLAHSRRASSAASIAWLTCAGSAACQSASTCRWSCGITDCSVRPVLISHPPITSGMSIRSPAICASRALSSARSGEAGQVGLILIVGGKGHCCSCRSHSEIRPNQHRRKSHPSTATHRHGLHAAVHRARSRR